MSVEPGLLRAKALVENLLPQGLHAWAWTRLHRFRARARQDLVPLVIRFEGEHVLVSDGGDIELSIASYRRRAWYQRGIAARMEFLLGQYRVGLDELGPGDTLIDIGSNIGEFSLYWARRGVRVLAIEADPEIFTKLERNLAPYPNATCLHMAVWKEPSELEFFSSVHTADSSVIRPETFERVVRVPADTLDNIVVSQGFEAVSLIKCDAEGAEPEVFSGATNTLSLVRTVVVDVGPERGGVGTDKEVGDLLISAGMSIAPAVPATRIVMRASRAQS